MLVPYWNHAMTPYWDPEATGIVVGWTGTHSRAHVFRAILEGIAYEQRLVGDAIMDAVGGPFREYLVLGGGSRSDLWCEILADVTGVRITRSATTEATCLGAGILAAAAVGWYPDPVSAAQSMTATGKRFAPNAARHAIYDRLFRDVYKQLYPTLQPLIHRLTMLSREEPD
jgi:xylulokinase